MSRTSLIPCDDDEPWACIPPGPVHTKCENSDSGEVKTQDLGEHLGEHKGIFKIEPTYHTRAVVCVAWSPDGDILASCDTIRINLWNTKTWKLIKTLPIRFSSGAYFEWSPCGSMLAVCSGKNQSICGT